MTLSARLTLLIVAIVLTTAVVTAVVVDGKIKGALAPLDLERQQSRTHLVATALATQVNLVRGDVLTALLAGEASELARAAREGTPPHAEARARTERVFLAQLNEHPDYLQLRVIGASGLELLRVDRDRPGTKPHVVAATDLQDKSHHAYVGATMAMAHGQVFVSAVDLNREHGAIVSPPQPVLRAATPIVNALADGQDRVDGLVVVNVDMGSALEAARFDSRLGGANYVVNADGHYLVHPDRAREFGFERGPSPRLQDDYPALADVLGADGVKQQTVAGAHGDEFLVVAQSLRLALGPRVTVLSFSPARGGAGVTEGVRRGTLLVIALAAVLGAALGAVVATTVTRPLSRITAAAAKVPYEGDAGLPTDRRDEIGLLARELERMNRTVRDRRDALEAQERRFRAAVEGAPNAIVLVDEQQRVTLANAKAEELFGYDAGGLLGLPIEALVPERFRAAHTEHAAAYQANPNNRNMGRELLALRKDGSEVAVEVGLSPLGAPPVKETLAALIDISDRKRHADELRRSNEDLERFATVASHDLQEPLRMVVNYMELLVQRYGDQLDARAQKYIHYATDGGRRMQLLVASLLQYSRVGTQGKPLVEVDLAQTVERLRVSLGPLLNESGATLNVGPLPRVVADDVQMHQLFQNLIVNAIKFRREEAPVVSVTAAATDAMWRVTVADNGIGFEQEHAEHIFQMFQRLNAGAYEGSGIGLAIVKRIVERHGGTISVESTPSVGSRFHFTLRSAPGPSA